MSPVRETCAAAQFGRETAHLQYAYFVAVFFAEEHHGVGFCASSMLIMAALTATLAKMASLTRRSTSAISSAVTAWGWEMSKRVDSAVTKEPFCSTCPPNTSRRALCIRWVALWLRILALRISSSTLAVMLSPTFRRPEVCTPNCPNTTALIFGYRVLQSGFRLRRYSRRRRLTAGFCIERVKSITTAPLSPSFNSTTCPPSL